MYLWSKFEESFRFGYLDTELNPTGKNFLFSMFNHPRCRDPGPTCIAASGRFSRDVYLWTIFEDSIIFRDLETGPNATGEYFLFLCSIIREI